MAKGLRSSIKKSNRSKLRARVFEPVENARLERLHQKLLEAAQQEKPEPPKKNEMEVDSTEGNSPNLPDCTSPLTCRLPDTQAANGAGNEDDFPKGLSFLTASIPRSLRDDNTNTNPNLFDAAQDTCASNNLFHLLGLCSDVVGFADDGDLKFAFDPLPPHWLSDQGLTVSS